MFRVNAVRAAREAGLMGVLAVAAAAGAQTAPLNGWTPTWSDEFSGTTLDGSKWWAANEPGVNNGELQYYRPGNVWLENGRLIIKAERQDYGGRAYVSGLVRTPGKFAQQYGRFEVRAKLPKTQGLWPAIWMLPASGAWPPEIDIMEMIGSNPYTVYATNHWGTYPWPYSYQNTPIPGPDYSAGAHTFAVEWDPGRLDFFVDGARRATHYGGVPSEPFYLIINTAVGGGFPGYPDGSTVLPQYMEVEYARVYARTLFNAVFESGGGLEGWGTFGGRTAVTGAGRGGSTALKLWGQDAGPGAPSGAYQDFATRPGQQWRASAWWRNPGNEPLAGGTRAYLKMEWYDAGDALLGADEEVALTEDSPRDREQLVTVEAAAPAGAVRGRLVLVLVQPWGGTGAVYADDADLQPGIKNGSFDDAPILNATPSGWSASGSVIASAGAKRSGGAAVRLFGASGSVNRASQDFACRPGERYALEAWWQQTATDFLRSTAAARLMIEWRDAAGGVLATDLTDALNAASPRGVFVKREVVGTAPAQAAWGRAVLQLTQGASGAGSAYVDDVRITKLLNNAGAEDLGPAETEPLRGWVGFGQRYAEVVYARSGARAGKLFGNFSGGANVSGVYQDRPARAGERWRGGAWWINASSDFMRGANFATTGLEWLDESGSVIAARTLRALDAASATDTYALVRADAVAPPGTRRVRLALNFVQPGLDAGAAFFDDAELTRVNACAGDLNADGYVDDNDFVIFAQGYDLFTTPPAEPGADLNCDGFVDDTDFVIFAQAYDTFVCPA